MQGSTEDLSLYLSGYDIKLSASYLESILPLRYLEIEGLLKVNLFLNLNLSDLSPVAVLSPKNAVCESFQNLSFTINSLINSSKIIALTNAQSFDCIYFLYPTSNFYAISLYMVKVDKFLGNSIENYLLYIESIRSSIEDFIKIYKDAEIAKENFIEKAEISKKKCDSIYNGSKKVRKEILKLKRTIVTLAEEFNSLEKNFENLECLNCKSNLKNVLFLPCGHFTICEECLKNDFKVTPNLPITGGKLRCSKCRTPVTQALISTNFHN